MLLFMCKASVKLSALAKFLDHLVLSRKEKVLVYVDWPLELWQVRLFCDIAQIPSVMLMAGQTPAERSEAVHAFNEDSTVMLCIASSRAAATSYNMHRACHHALFLDPISIQTQLQCIGRLVRLGQTHQVRIWRVIVNFTFDQVIEEKALAKYIPAVAGMGVWELTDKQYDDYMDDDLRREGVVKDHQETKLSMHKIVERKYRPKKAAIAARELLGMNYRQLDGTWRYPVNEPDEEGNPANLKEQWLQVYASEDTESKAKTAEDMVSKFALANKDLFQDFNDERAARKNAIMQDIIENEVSTPSSRNLAGALAAQKVRADSANKARAVEVHKQVNSQLGLSTDAGLAQLVASSPSEDEDLELADGTIVATSKSFQDRLKAAQEKAPAEMTPTRPKSSALLSLAQAWEASGATDPEKTARRLVIPYPEDTFPTSSKSSSNKSPFAVDSKKSNSSTSARVPQATTSKGSLDMFGKRLGQETIPKPSATSHTQSSTSATKTSDSATGVSKATGKWKDFGKRDWDPVGGNWLIQPEATDTSRPAPSEKAPEPNTVSKEREQKAGGPSGKPSDPKSEVKKPEDPKPEVKKPKVKKPDDKKPHDKRSDDKKAGNTKGADKKAADKKAANKKAGEKRQAETEPETESKTATRRSSRKRARKYYGEGGGEAEGGEGSPEV